MLMSYTYNSVSELTQTKGSLVNTYSSDSNNRVGSRMRQQSTPFEFCLRFNTIQTIIMIAIVVNHHRHHHWHFWILLSVTSTRRENLSVRSNFIKTSITFLRNSLTTPRVFLISIIPRNILTL